MTDYSGIERLCAGKTPAWVRSRRLAGGVELLQARLVERGFDPHRHATYAIGVTDSGVQTFTYRGERRVSTSGQVVVLHPDETHDGRAGDENGFEYRIVYLCPMRVFDAVETLTRRRRPLPFVSSAVCRNASIARAVCRAFSDESVPLASDALTVELAQGLLEQERQTLMVTKPPAVDMPALERAQEFLDSELSRPVTSKEIEAVTGLNRYELSRQFRTCFGTSPYRYSLLRRLESVRRKLSAGMSIAAIAGQHGFADQAHLTRHFRATFGVTPQRYRRLGSSSNLRTSH